MIKKGDKIAIVSLSSGILGERFSAHQLKIGKKRLEDLGFEVVFMENSLKGLKILQENPKLRAYDLINAFKDKTIKGIICAIGGNDTYKTIEYIFENQENIEIIKNNPKFFMGYSDSTINHIMLYKLGINSFYGLSFLTDFAELDKQMLPYTLSSFKNIINNQIVRYCPSHVVYDEREKFDESQINTSRNAYKEKYGYLHINGKTKFSGKLFGGCLEVIYSFLTDEQKSLVNDKYEIFPKNFEDKVIFLETSENKIKPEEFKKMLLFLKEKGLFENIAGLIIAKPQNEKYLFEYEQVLKEIFSNTDVSVAYNFNFGHSYPKMILQYNAFATVDLEDQFLEIKGVR